VISGVRDLVVRTHVPVRVGLGVVLVPLGEADRVMRDIARGAWPDDPSPLEEQVHREAEELIYEAVDVLATGEREDDERWQEALEILDPCGVIRRYRRWLRGELDG
jgi:hypothetical protein